MGNWAVVYTIPCMELSSMNIWGGGAKFSFSCMKYSCHDFIMHESFHTGRGLGTFAP